MIIIAGIVYCKEEVICQLPIVEAQMDEVIKILEMLGERSDTMLILCLDDEEYEEDVPNSILVSSSLNGFYMELTYSMEDWEWDYPLILANDHLDQDEVLIVLKSILLDCTDQISLIGSEFGEISTSLFI